MTQEDAMKKLETDINLRGMSPHTCKEYKDRVRVFLRHFQDVPIDELGETEFRIFLEYLNREKTWHHLPSITIIVHYDFPLKLLWNKPYAIVDFQGKKIPSKFQLHLPDKKYCGS